MNADNSMKLPLRLVVLDAMGAILLGLGLAELIAHTNLVPEQFRFENYEVAMIACGVVFMMPMIVHIIARAAKARRVTT